MAGKAGRGPGTLESEVEVIAKEADVYSDEPGGEKPVIWPVIFAPVAYLARRASPSNLSQYEYQFTRTDYTDELKYLHGL